MYKYRQIIKTVTFFPTPTRMTVAAKNRCTCYFRFFVWVFTKMNSKQYMGNHLQCDLFEVLLYRTNSKLFSLFHFEIFLSGSYVGK